MTRIDSIKLVTALVFLGMAGALVYRFIGANRNPDALAFYYDLSERKLFTAPRTSVPPIRGLNNAEEDGVRAVVISRNGDPEDKNSREIAYLEKYSPELREQIVAMQSGNTSAPPASGRIGRSAAGGFIYVRRLQETNWHAANSAEALQIMTEWQVPRAGKTAPVVCMP